MELRQLEYFVAVAEEASFTRAAARVHIAQSGVSAQIRRLERELGQPLLDRSGRSVRLTEVGAAVLSYARAALGAVAGARLVVDEFNGLLRGHVRFGMVTSSSGSIELPALLARFHREHPAVEISLTEATSDQLVGALLARRLDAAIIAPGATTPPGLDVRPVADEAMVAAVHPDDPLAGRGSVTLAELSDRTLISFPRSVGARVTVDDAFAAAGLPARVSIEASDPDVLAELAAAGLGVALLPEPYPRARGAGLRVLPIAGVRLRGRIALARHSDGPVGPAARALIRHLEEIALLL